MPVHADTDLVLAFGPRAILQDSQAFAAVREAYPGAQIVGASTGGQIHEDAVSDGRLALAAVHFDTSSVGVASATIRADEPDEALGQRLAGTLHSADHAGRPLAHVFVLADGLSLNGSAFAAGVEAALPDGVAVTGGLAGDDDRFEQTTLWADARLEAPSVVAVAFYGDRLRVGVGAAGGWDTFGVERHITRSDGNVLAELDGQPALDLYERYLGPYAADLPASGLRFPLGIRVEGSEHEMVRTLLGVDHEARTLTFAGDMPEGATARLMRSNPDHLAVGAHQAARQAAETLGVAPQMALLVSCVGRKWTMGERIAEEVEEARAALSAAPSIGFYSYGELAPPDLGGGCALHNQTMTITALAEV